MSQVSSNPIKTNVLGYPRIGEKRQLKKATESYWKGQASKQDLLRTGRDIRKKNWLIQKNSGVGLIPSNDFSYYDQMLDMSCLLGVVPDRFKWAGEKVDLETTFYMARGKQVESPDAQEGGEAKETTFACEMTKWFDTNYHYIVPELHKDLNFKVSSSKVFDEFNEALDQGIKTKPVLIGPVTYLTLGKSQDAGFDRFSLIDKLIPVYIEILQKLQLLGAEWIQIDEPIFSLNLSSEQVDALEKAYIAFAKAVPKLNVMAANYFGDLRDNRDLFLNLPVDGLHVDLVRAPKELDAILENFPEDVILSLGIVDGRNIWKNNYVESMSLLTKAKEKLGADRVMVASSCSLIHSPVTLRNEEKLDDEFKNWLAFSEEKIAELTDLADALNGERDAQNFDANAAAAQSRSESTRIHNPQVKERCANVTEADANRKSTFAERQKAQRAKIQLPSFPTTTIGSFPQTKEVRATRAKFKKGEITQEQYDNFVEEEIKKAIQIQDEIGLDMVVHGEFERNDMVEYFGELLDGFAFTEHGWVQSYGSRYVKPPIIFGDVSRPKPMTVRWSTFTQSLTKKPVKGMLTGPITVLQWSFVRNDQPRSETTKQIAVALRDEVVDLEASGIAAIQIDEPAVREGLPLRKEDWQDYLKWAVESFRLSASGVKDETQIHTHMCYSEFNDIIQAIADLDADVISIETSRSQMELLDAFVGFKYPNEIGPGVYDIHSPRIPETSEMENLLRKAEQVLPQQNIWVNPDCGLKTRAWEEVIPALTNMVASAKALREEVNETVKA